MTATIYECQDCGWTGPTDSNCPKCAGEVRTASAAEQPAVDRAAAPSQAPTDLHAAIPAEIVAIIERLHTQDNRITSHPLFAVQQKRVIAGLEDGYEEAHEWINEDSETIHDAEEIATLEAAYREGADTPGARRIGVAWHWEFVTGCFTEQGCKDFIAVNGHNLNEPRIYAYSGYRNAEFIAVREWLMSLRAAAELVAAASQAPQQPVGTITSMVKGGVTWQTWPDQLPDGTKLYASSIGRQEAQVPSGLLRKALEFTQEVATRRNVRLYAEDLAESACTLLIPLTAALSPTPAAPQGGAPTEERTSAPAPENEG